MSLFKAYDIRGVYGEDLTEDLAYKFGRAFVTFLNCKTVAVGHDMRDHSLAIEQALINGITDQGADVVKIGIATTPMLYYAVAKHGYESGINVTASHNPAKYNGFKLVNAGAVPISGDNGIYDMRDLVEKNEFEDAPKGRVSEKEGILQEYLENALNFTDVSKLKKYKIIADTGNGMAGLIIPDLLKRIPCEFTHMYPELDGSFPNHEANPLKHETLKDLQAEVKKQNADVGVAFDGDSDRIGFVDERGEIVESDLFTALIAIEMLKHQPGSKVLFDLRSSLAVPEAIKASGGIPIESRVGHSFIKASMRKESAIFAGEVSGHYYIKENYYIESPFIVLILLLKLMTETDKTLSELIKPLRKYHGTGELNFKVDDKDAKIQKVREMFSDAKRIYELDGLSITYDEWWLNLRPSNTEPLLRLTIEAKTAEKRDEIKDKVLKILKS